MIGNLGKIITFEVSDEKVLTFSGLSRTGKGRWATHNIIGKRPKSEFLGPDLQDITFKIHVTAMHGVRPRKTLKAIRKAALNGTVMDFVVGGQRVGSNKWVITSVSEAWGCVYAKGDLISADVSLSLREYV